MVHGYKSAVAAVALLSAAASAQNSTASLWLIGFDQQSAVGSVITADATATTYSIGCGIDDSDSCGIPPSFTVTQGPSTVRYILTNLGGDGGDAGAITLGCQVTDSKSASCTATLTGTSNGAPTSNVTSTTLGPSDLTQLPVTITAGAAAGSAKTTAATSTGAASGSAGAAQSSGSAAPSSKSAAAAAPMVTGNAQWIVGGAAAALALAAL